MGGLDGLSYIPLTFHQIPWSCHEYMSCLSAVAVRRGEEFYCAGYIVSSSAGVVKLPWAEPVIENYHSVLSLSVNNQILFVSCVLLIRFAMNFYLAELHSDILSNWQIHSSCFRSLSFTCTWICRMIGIWQF